MVRAVNSESFRLIDPNGRLLQVTYAEDPYRNPIGRGRRWWWPRRGRRAAAHRTWPGNLFKAYLLHVAAIAGT